MSAATDKTQDIGPNYEVKSGKTLLGNWVEERQCAHIDQEPRVIKEIHVEGHKGVLTTRFESKVEGISTCRDSYQNPTRIRVTLKGRKHELLEKQLYEQISAQVQEEFTPQPPTIDYTSTTKSDFTKDYTPIERKSLMEHDVNKEQAVTFWSKNLTDIHGVSQVRTQDTAFKKNAAFSTPIDEYKDAPKPGEKQEF